MKIPYFKPYIPSSYKKYIAKVINSGHLTYGKISQEIESYLRKYLKIRDFILTSSATHSLFILLKTIPLTQSSKIITTPLTFTATAEVIPLAGAKITFVDTTTQGLISYSHALNAITPETKAVITVNLYGQYPPSLNTFAKELQKNNVLLIEDSAHGLEMQRDGISPGQVSYAAVFSFYANKNITSGEGGGIATNNIKLAKTIRKLINHGISKPIALREGPYHFLYNIELMGFKANFSDIQAAILKSQLKLLKQWNQKRAYIANYYDTCINNLDTQRIRPLITERNYKLSNHIYPILVDNRSSFVTWMYENGIEVSSHYQVLHLTKAYKWLGYKKGSFPNAEYISEREVSLPIYPLLSEKELEYICDVIIKWVRK